MSDGLQILRAIERQHDVFRLMQKGVKLDINSGDIYIVRGKDEGIPGRSGEVVA